MKKKTKHFWLSLFAIITVVAFLVWYLVVSFFAEEAPAIQQEQVTHIDVPFQNNGTVTIRSTEGTALYNGNIEIATTEQQREQGLMYRDSIARNQGMLFVFSEPTQQAFWMKNTRMPLDIIYIGPDKSIVSIAANAQPFDQTSLPSEGPAQYVLEIQGGLSEQLGIKAGDIVEWAAN